MIEGFKSHDTNKPQQGVSFSLDSSKAIPFAESASNMSRWKSEGAIIPSKLPKGSKVKIVEEGFDPRDLTEAQAKELIKKGVDAIRIPGDEDEVFVINPDILEMGGNHPTTLKMMRSKEHKSSKFEDFVKQGNK